MKDLIKEFIEEILLEKKKKSKKKKSKKKKVPAAYLEGLKGEEIKIYTKLYHMCNPTGGKEKPAICFKHPWPGEKRAAERRQKEAKKKKKKN